MSIGDLGWEAVERLIWTSLSLPLGAFAAWLVSRLNFIPPAAKAWTWRMVVLQATIVFVSNFGVALPVPEQTQGAASAPLPWMAALGAGLAALWLVPALHRILRLLKAAVMTRRMLLELPEMTRPTGAAGAASYRLMRELSCPVAALCPQPVIAGPEWCWQNSEQARLALAHEYAHIRRGDVIWQVVGSLAAALFWFHPVAARAFAELSFWQECAADAEAMATVSCDSHDYATAIVDIVAGARTPNLPLALGLGMQARQLGRRLEVAVDAERIRPWLGAAVAFLVIAPALIPWRMARAESDDSDLRVKVSGPTGPVSPIRMASAAGGG